MSVEPSQWLAESASKLGFEIHNVGPASADLRMHSVYKFAKKPSWWQRFKCWFKGVEIEPVWHEVRLFDSERFSFKPGFSTCALQLNTSAYPTRIVPLCRCVPH